MVIFNNNKNYSDYMLSDITTLRRDFYMREQKEHRKSITSIKTKILAAVSALVADSCAYTDYNFVYDFQEYNYGSVNAVT